MSADRRQRRTELIPAAYSLLLALIVLGPLLSPGYLLLRDAVSTPRSYLTDSALGLGDAAPRAVPQDALIAVLSPFIDGGLIVKAILLAAIWLAGWGAAALSRELLQASLGPQLVAATIAIWNPYVAERLLQGHWSLLTGYAALPWIALLATRLRATTPSPRWPLWAALTAWLATAGLTPTGSLLAGALAILLVGRRNLLATATLWLATSAPWLIATALSGAGSTPSDPAGVAAFAARAEPFLGTLGSLAGLGGIWNSTAVPDTRTTFYALIGTSLLLALVATGIRTLLGRPTDPTVAPARAPAAAAPRTSDAALADDATGPLLPNTAAAVRHTQRVLLVVALAAIALPALGATGWGLSVGEFLVTNVPGAGLLRDTQKYVALAVPAFALCAAAGCQTVARRLTAAGTSARDREFIGGGNELSTDSLGASEATSTGNAPILGGNAGAPGSAKDFTTGSTLSGVGGDIRTGDEVGRGGGPTMAGPVRTGWLAAIFVVLVLVSLPDMAWGVGGALRPVEYPAAWGKVAGVVAGEGDVAVLPGGMFRKFRWSGSVPVLDPAPRMLARDVLQTGELPVQGATVSGEGARARAVERLLLKGGSAAELARLGVGWVLVEGGTPGPVGESKTTLAQLNSVYTDKDLQLYRVPGSIAGHDASAEARRVAGAAHLLWGALLFGGFLAAGGFGISRRRSGSPVSQPVP